MARKDSVDEMLDAWHRRDPELDASPLSVVGRLLLCSRHLEHDLVRVLEEHELSFGDFDVLNSLYRDGEAVGLTPKRLSESALITSGAMTTRLDRLERTGLISREPDRVDRRGQRVRLTARGRRTARAAIDSVLEADRAFLRALSPTRRRALATGLRELLLAQESP